jgi:hypothetical protein
MVGGRRHRVDILRLDRSGRHGSRLRRSLCRGASAAPVGCRLRSVRPVDRGIRGRGRGRGWRRRGGFRPAADGTSGTGSAHNPRRRAVADGPRASDRTGTPAGSRRAPGRQRPDLVDRQPATTATARCPVLDPVGTRSCGRPALAPPTAVGASAQTPPQSPALLAPLPPPLGPLEPAEGRLHCRGPVGTPIPVRRHTAGPPMASRRAGAPLNAETAGSPPPRSSVRQLQASPAPRSFAASTVRPPRCYGHGDHEPLRAHAVESCTVRCGQSPT